LGRFRIEGIGKRGKAIPTLMRHHGLGDVYPASRFDFEVAESVGGGLVFKTRQRGDVVRGQVFIGSEREKTRIIVVADLYLDRSAVLPQDRIVAESVMVHTLVNT